jgi:IMP dehydrogenase
VDAGVDCLVLDIAHAHSDLVIEKLKELKIKCPVDIMVGNIATAQAAKDLINAGADGLKVGIGPSGVCTTRLIAGAGVPQLTAVMDVVKISKEHNVPVTADGGMKYPGDISKAIAAGASSIYSGSFFAGTDEAPGRIFMKDGKRYKKYHGSASYESNHNRKEMQVKKQLKERLNVFVEGVSSLVDYKGCVSDVIESLIKGLQSGMSYCGARNIEEMWCNASFVQITSAGFEESKSRGMKTQD